MGAFIWFVQQDGAGLLRGLGDWLNVIAILSGWLVAVGFFLWRGGGKQHDYEARLKAHDDKFADHGRLLEELKQGDHDIRVDRTADKRVLLEMSLFMERADTERAEMRGDIGEIRGEVKQLMQVIHENERAIRHDIGQIAQGQASINATIEARLDITKAITSVGDKLLDKMTSNRAQDRGEHR